MAGNIAPDAAPRERYIPRGSSLSWWMLVVTTGAILVTSVDRAILFRTLPAIQQEFGLSNTAAGFLGSLTSLGVVIGALALGVLGDALGKGVRRAWTWGVAVVITIVASAATAFVQTLGGLQFWRVIMGVGTGGMEPVNVAMVSEWWQKENRGFAVGTHHTGFPIGQFFGPLLIGAVLAVATWRAVFLFVPLIAIPIVILQMILARRRNLEQVNGWIRDHGMTPSVEVDELERRDFKETVLAAGRSLRIALRNRNVRLAVAMAFCFLFAEFGVDTFLTIYLNQEIGIPLAAAAVISGASGLTGWIGQIAWGTLSDGIGRKVSLAIVAVGWTLTVLLMILITSAATAWLILLAWGLFRNSPFPVAYSLLIDSVPDAASSGMGLIIGLAVGGSAIISSTAAGFVIDTFGYTLNFVFLAIPCALALIPIAFMRETLVTGGETAEE